MTIRKVEDEEIRLIREVPKGEFIKSIAMKSGRVFQRVYVKGDYDRSLKAYECYAFDDVNQCIYLKANRKVLVGFTF